MRCRARRRAVRSGAIDRQLNHALSAGCPVEQPLVDVMDVDLDSARPGRCAIAGRLSDPDIDETTHGPLAAHLAEEFGAVAAPRADDVQAASAFGPLRTFSSKRILKHVRLDPRQHHHASPAAQARGDRRFAQGQVHNTRRAPVILPVEQLSASDAELVSLYREAWSKASYGFSCVPAAYPGGPIAPRYERLRERLKKRRLRVREQIGQRVGTAYIQRLEDDMQRELDAVAAEVHVSCAPEDTARARRRYARLLAKLEKRLGGSH